MKTLRIITTLRMVNLGALLFCQAMQQSLDRCLPEYDIRFIDHTIRQRYIYEILRALKPQPGDALFNLRRFAAIEKMVNMSLRLEQGLKFPFGYEDTVRFLQLKQYDALVVGMVIWDLKREWYLPEFPNIHWLSENISATKIAYAASGHRSDFELLKKNRDRIRRILGSYAILGVRDQITWEMLMESGVGEDAPVFRSPDPVFIYRHNSTEARNILTRHGIDPTRPMLGTLYYGKRELSKQICDYFRDKDYQIVSLSLFNPNADVNLGDKITPSEWIDLVRLMDFCVGDRFHGTVLSLKANKPFISVEPYQPKTIMNSKIFSLLSDFELPECYLDVYQPGFNFDIFRERVEMLDSEWETEFHPRVAIKLEQMKQDSRLFLEKVSGCLS